MRIALLKKRIMLPLLLLGVVLLPELSMYFLVQKTVATTGAADLLMVFPGDSNRIETGLRLAAEGRGSMLAVSGLSVNTLENRAASQANLQHLLLIGTDKSRSTFEDVLNVSRVVQRYKIHSLLLITSDYHLPRSYFLLRCYLAGSGIAIHTVPVAGWPAGNTISAKILQERAEMFVNETLKFWGSCVEMGWMMLSGRPLLDEPFFLKLHYFVKRKILF